MGAQDLGNVDCRGVCLFGNTVVRLTMSLVETRRPCKLNQEQHSTAYKERWRQKGSRISDLTNKKKGETPKRKHSKVREQGGRLLSHGAVPGGSIT